MLVSLYFLGSNLNVNLKPENRRPSRDTTGIEIHVLKIKEIIYRYALHNDILGSMDRIYNGGPITLYYNIIL